MRIERIQEDVLIIGGGTAGCYAALTIARKSAATVVICEKANIKRSGCLAAGVNAINAYIIPGKTPEDYVDYAKWDAKGIVREDLLLTMAQGLNRVTKDLEDMGLVILKDAEGNYVTRGNRNIKINGENIKPLLAQSVEMQPNVRILNKTNVIDYIVHQNQIYGAIGLSVEEEILYVIEAKKVICATGGAAGLYGPNHKGFSRHKMWYPPFNTGAGYALGIEAGAEMTTFEMRFIALRCKDTIAPTGTLAQGTGTKQVNSKGEVYEHQYGLRTCERVYGTVMEKQKGNGPCYLQTKGSSEKQVEQLYHAYLNMAPSQTLRWIETGETPDQYNTEIEGTEPYIVGGHTASGYWVDTKRRTTIKGLFAVGDVAGGCPQKYVTGALVEGEIAGLTIVEELKQSVISSDGEGNSNTESYLISITERDTERKTEGKIEINTERNIEREIDRIIERGTGGVIASYIQSVIERNLNQLKAFLQEKESRYCVDELEETMQKIMDDYVGGISSNYQYNEASLERGEHLLRKLQLQVKTLNAKNMDDLLRIYELRDRLTVCFTVIAHLKERKETRWNSFASHMDYLNDSPQWLKYINSKKVHGKLHMIHRELVTREEIYEHSD